MKHSRFISYLIPKKGYREAQDMLRSAHPKSSHIAYAFRFRGSSGRIEEGSSDDGEPKGCAGVPVLSAMRGADIIECVLLVVRYFGGTKLGTGGMARAYARAANSAIRAASLQPYRELCRLDFASSYSDIERIRHMLSSSAAVRTDMDFCDMHVEWRVELPAEEAERLAAILGDLGIGRNYHGPTITKS